MRFESTRKPALTEMLRGRLPAILEIEAVDGLDRASLFTWVPDAVGAERVALEEDVGAAGRVRRTVVELERRDVAARLVAEERIELGAHLEVVHRPSPFTAKL